ncbi:helix-turn-helix transcriptional regulator [Caenispirillum salinarum]|uniref:helix-turn-helix transcriptional regulator n=1 Tax=Caenispirillum salinarum TaxID=859058 RepID=UPI00385033C1
MSTNLLALRRTLGLSQAEFAKRLQTTQSTVCRWEKGHVAPSPEMRAKMARLVAGTPAVRDWHVLRTVRAHPGLAKLFDPTLEILEVSQHLAVATGIGRENLTGRRLSGVFERALKEAEDAGMLSGVPISLEFVGPMLPIRGCEARVAWSWTMMSLSYGAPYILAQGRPLRPEEDAAAQGFTVVRMGLEI